MKNDSKLVAVAIAAVFAGVSAQAQSTITGWDFDLYGTVVAPDNSPASNQGPVAGTATVLGMNNTYNSTTSTANADILATAGASTGAGSDAWRIRGTPGNGWSSQAPIASQGAEFATSTAGYTGIAATFDLYTTTQGEAKMAVEYTLDGSSWTPATISYGGSGASVLVNSTSTSTVTGDYLNITGGQNWYNQISVSLPAGAANDPSFAIEVVNAATGTDDTAATGGGPYNNSSGNWRLDNVEITGTSAVPEPSVIGLVGMGVAGLAGQLRRRSGKN